MVKVLTYDSQIFFNQDVLFRAGINLAVIFRPCYWSIGGWYVAAHGAVFACYVKNNNQRGTATKNLTKQNPLFEVLFI